MKNIFYSSKDEIRNRILKNARDYWGIKTATDFDPLVKLLIEALSTELFNVSNEVKNLENRILDKISRILASDTLTTALPAHAILQARPFEGIDTLEPTAQFFYKKKTKGSIDESKEQAIDIFFSPLKPVKVFNAAVSYFATANHFFQFDGNHNKTLIASAVGKQADLQNTVFLGVEVAPTLTSIQGMSFFFDWKNYLVNEELYDLISLSQWTLNHQPVQLSLDKFYQEKKKSIDPAFEKHDVFQVLTKDIHSLYANRFLTIDQQDLLPPDKHIGSCPEVLSQRFPAAIEQIKAPVLWFKIQFPAAFTEQLLDELHVSVNAFPVVNKKMNDIKHRLKMMSNIIPVKIQDNEQFLSVHGLSDKQGHPYTEIPHSEDEEKSTGSYAIRYGGTERFDNRNAKEVVDYLFELLRDEKAAFSAYGSEFLSSTLKDLEQNISIIEQKTKTQLSNIKELLNYIIVKPQNGADIMFLDFWTTNAELGNAIRSGSRLQAFENSKIKPETLILLSNTVGGRSRLNASNRVQAYKYGLTTADRIVTKSDIINFCHYELGNKVRNIEIRKGLMTAQDPKAGFIKTTDIVVEPADRHQLNEEEWKSILLLTKSKLENRSIMNIHYRLFLS